MSFNFVIPEFNIGGAGTPPLQFFRRGFNLGGSGSVDWREITLSGVGALTLTNAKANSLSSLKLFGGTEQELLPNTYQLYTSVEANGVTYEYSSQNLTQIPCKRIADNVFGLYNYTTKVFISEV